ncbi:MAG: extracellular solute-binding protein [Ruminococcus sp.]|uniref:ABC transporter substrate-binding protein n=1 Tax=Ruminococcus sp. TaxID=41978 RepID=UPI0025E3B7C4|nr:extracellular solute-binding protein [Ruminococcus sp.]MCR5600696.1 extracellular solute-binding protein [Ruminococcus sp.]
MKKNILRTLAFISSACLALCSCSEAKKGSSVSSDSAAQKNENTAQSLADFPENSYKLQSLGTISSINHLFDIIKASDEGYYATGCDEKNSVFMYKVSPDFSDFRKLEFEIPEEVKNADENHSEIIFNKNGDAAIFYTIIDNGGQTMPEFYDENFDFDAFYENQKISYALCFYNADRTIKKFIDLRDAEGFSDPEQHIYPISSFLADSDTLITTLTDSTSYIFRSDGSYELLNIDSEGSDEYNQNGIILLRGSDNAPYALLAHNMYSNSDEKNKIYSLDIENKTLGKEVYTDNISSHMLNTSYNYQTGYGDYLFIGVSDDDVIGVRADGTTEPIFKWVEADTTKMSLVPAENGEFFCWVNNYYDDKENTDIYKLVHRTTDDLQNCRLVTIAAFGSSPLNYYIGKFNREQDKYRVQVVDYSEPLTEEEQNDKSLEAVAQRLDDEYNKLKLDIISGNAPDMFMLSHSDAELLGKKGVLLDLYTLMDKDKEINRSTVMPNILRALENSSGKLCSIVPNFTVSTYAAKEKLVDHENWTLQEMIDLFDTKNAEHSYDTLSKQEMFDIMLNADSKLVDIEKSKCHFNTPEFVELLKFCNRFVDEVEYADKSNMNAFNEYWQDRSKWLADEKVLIAPVHLSCMCDLVYEKYDFGGDDIKLVGFPTTNGKGGKLELNYEFSISADSDAKEGAWEFIKMIMKESTLDETYDPSGKGDLMGGYSVINEIFDKQLSTMSSVKRMDENGNMIEETSFESQGRILHVLTNSELADLKRYILSCDTISDTLDADAFSVCREESEAYFHGEKSAEEAAEMMQNRISILVSEKS